MYKCGTIEVASIPVDAIWFGAFGLGLYVKSFRFEVCSCFRSDMVYEARVETYCWEAVHDWSSLVSDLICLLNLLSWHSWLGVVGLGSLV